MVDRALGGAQLHKPQFEADGGHRPLTAACERGTQTRGPIRHQLGRGDAFPDTHASLWHALAPWHRP